MSDKARPILPGLPALAPYFLLAVVMKEAFPRPYRPKSLYRCKYLYNNEEDNEGPRKRPLAGPLGSDAGGITLAAGLVGPPRKPARSRGAGTGGG